MPAITAPTPSVRQVSAEQGKAWILAVLAKRAYRVLPGGQCVPSPEEAPLSNEIVTSPDDDNLLVQDLDVLPNKPRTDVIVKGHAYAGTPKPGVEVSIQVAATARTSSSSATAAAQSPRRAPSSCRRRSPSRGCP